MLKFLQAQQSVACAFGRTAAGEAHAELGASEPDSLCMWTVRTVPNTPHGPLYAYDTCAHYNLHAIASAH